MSLFGKQLIRHVCVVVISIFINKRLVRVHSVSSICEESFF